MMLVKYTEIIVIHMIMLIFLPFNVFYFSLLSLIAFISIYFSRKKDIEKQKDKKLLELLSRFNNYLNASDSPLYAYEKLDKFDYPSFIIHPSDPNFTYTIFNKQFLLFEKRVLLRDEMDSEFSVVRLRMHIMKWLPLLFIIGLKLLIGENPSIIINIICVSIFIFNYHISNLIMEF